MSETTATSGGGPALVVRMIEMPQATKDAIARNIELGREWRKGFDDGRKAGFSSGMIAGLMFAAILSILAMVAVAFVNR